ncbi:MAG TPA: arginine deiminase family protein [Pyrinomonadaceae bacterium]|nr:arginine deiminase family protein [Pyrinomonadaceae bacterium]
MFTRAIVRPPATNFANGITTSNLGLPDRQRALRQHEAYCEALVRCGLEVIRLDADERYPDSTFVEDTAVIVEPTSNTVSRIVFTRPGAASRAGEVESIKESFDQLGCEAFSIEPPGTLDGGDVCQADNHFFIGISERTNESGAEQLRSLLASWGYTSTNVDIRKLDALLHLKSGMAYLGDRRLALVDALVSREHFRDYDIVCPTPPEEYGTNCVRLNEHVLIAVGFPAFQKTLTELGYRCIPLEMSEFQKMDGGLSCLSLRF